jgi:hypothetical protein
MLRTLSVTALILIAGPAMAQNPQPTSPTNPTVPVAPPNRWKHERPVVPTEGHDHPAERRSRDDRQSPGAQPRGDTGHPAAGVSGR